MTLQHDIFDYWCKTKIEHWVPLYRTLKEHFSTDETAMLQRSGRQFRNAARTVVMLSFENGCASLGGLAAVMKHLPRALAQHGEKVLLLTPLHSENTVVKEALDEGRLVKCGADIPIHMCNFTATLQCFKEEGASVPTYHLGVEGHFNAGDNPYGYARPQPLLMDAFAFCVAVPAALCALGYTRNILFHAHDWETAPITLFYRYAILSGVLESAKCVLTLHNSFDAPLSNEAKELFIKESISAYTVLQLCAPFVDGPITTVSTPFARELRKDSLQRCVFADHLQDIFEKNPPVGIENGAFGTLKPAFSLSDMVAAEAGDYSAILAKKRAWRGELLEIAAHTTDSRVLGSIDRSLLTNHHVPILFMSGRLDMMQKGYDVLFQAMRKIPRGKILLIFSPTPHTANDDLSFFKTILHECKGDIVIWPFRIDNESFDVFLRGSSFLVMPSLYEPFGSASEGLASGTPLIARATGGLLTQIIPETESAIPEIHRLFFPPGVSDYPNSILYREQCSNQIADESWRSLLEAPLEQRDKNPLYAAMVAAAAQALLRAAQLFSQPSEYGRMVVEGLHSVTGRTWERAVKKYREVYDTTQFRG